MATNLYRHRDYQRELEPEPFSSGFEKEEYRDQFRRDYARLVHSPGFRRLQGKTQLFPGVESDFFRNRLTHSLEVAQIAKSIALRINFNYNQKGKVQKGHDDEFGISPDLVEFAGLAHDLGHPPFGHQGEEALDSCILDYGGFEGNAQTLRLLTRIEKKFDLAKLGFNDGKDERVGLNLCMRTLASILKYDSVIPSKIDSRLEISKTTDVSKITPKKGYYQCDSELVQKIKDSVLNGNTTPAGSFKTVECTIMDIADDIAYSTYDLEDGFKAGFISPLDLLYPSSELLEKVREKVNSNLAKENISKRLTDDEIIDLIRENIIVLDDGGISEKYDNLTLGEHFSSFANSVVDLHYRTAKLLAENGSIRTGFTSSIVGRFIRGVELEYNQEHPALSKAKLDEQTRILVEILKTFTYLSQINSPRLKIAEVRGKEIVSKIFDELVKPSGQNLMPADVQAIHDKACGDYSMRIICDYIASMTDKYAIEFYGRLTSENPKTIFKPF